MWSRAGVEFELAFKSQKSVEERKIKRMAKRGAYLRGKDAF